MATRITREQQQEAGFNSPREFSDTLTAFENENRSISNLPNTPQVSGETITSSDLQPQKPFEIKPLAPVTEAPALQGQIETIADQFTSDLAQKAKNAEATSDIAQREYLESILGSTGEIESTAKAYSRKGGVDEIEGELIAINQQIRQEQNALRRQIERIQTSGGTKAVVNNEVDNAERVSLRKQADLAIIQMGIQGRYDSAKAIADRAVAVQMEQQSRVNEALRIQYEDNKDLLSQSEQRLYESRLADRNRQLDEQYYKVRAEYDQKLAQQDPLYQLQVITARKQLDLLGRETSAQQTSRTKAELEAIDKMNEDSENAQSAVIALEGKINLINALKESNALDSVVGTSFITRGPSGFLGTVGRIASVVGIPSVVGGAIDTLTGERQSFIGAVEQLIDQEFLDKLIDVKGQGATFGALSDAEGKALRSAASKIGTWRVRKGDPVSGTVVGYNASEDAFVAELNTIQELTQKALLKSQNKILTSDEDEFFNSLEQDSLSGFNAQQYYGF